jgi:ribosome-binding factor A
MSHDRELASAFFDSIEEGDAAGVEAAYRRYNSHIRSLSSQDYHLEYDPELVCEVGRAYIRWKIDNDENGGLT